VKTKDLVGIQHQKIVTKISQTRSPMRYDFLSSDISKKMQPPAALWGDQILPRLACSLFPFPVPTTLHSGNKMFSLFLFPQRVGRRITWYTLLNYSSPSVVHAFFENFDRKMVVVLSRLWLPLATPCSSGTAGWGASF